MKAVIPAAGTGTRLLPATKSRPLARPPAGTAVAGAARRRLAPRRRAPGRKKMLPVLDKPVIQYVAEEAVEAESDEILVVRPSRAAVPASPARSIVTGRGKRAIEDHFDHSVESHLERKGKTEALEELHAICELADIHHVRQQAAKHLAVGDGRVQREVAA